MMINSFLIFALALYCSEIFITQKIQLTSVHILILVFLFLSLVLDIFKNNNYNK